MWRPWLLVAAGVLLYAGSFSNPFVFDDLAWIRHDRIGALWPPAAALGGSSRPILNLSLALNYAVGGMNPTGYHVFNTVVHVLATLTLYGIVRRTLRSRPLRARYADAADGLAFAAALIWSVHPLATQAVAYVIQRAESLMALFYLLTLYCAIRSAASERRGAWTLAAWLCCALGMGTKEVMVSAPLVALLYDRTFLSGTFGAALRARSALYLGLAASWIVLLLRYESGAFSGGAAWAGFGLPDLSAVEYARSQPGVIVHYLRLAIWPHPLVLDYGWPVADAAAEILLPTSLLALLGVATLWALWRKPALGFLGACFFLALAPTSSVMPIVDLAFEHRMYLALAVLVVAAVLFADALLARAARPPGLGVALLLAVVVPLSATTLLRIRDYRSPLVLWQTVVDAAPGNARGHMNVGVALTKLGRNEEALAPLGRAIELDPDNAEAHSNLAFALIALGRTEEALSHYRRALEILPTYADAHSNYGRALQQRGEIEAALQHLRAAVRYDPRNATAQANLANALFRIDRPDEALQHFRESVRLDPYEPRPLAGAAWILATHPDPERREPAEAVRLAERAVELSRGADPTVLSTLATAYAAADQRERALRAAELALQRAEQIGAQREAQRIRAQLESYRRSAPDATPP
jgi:tetratricopeptide (TPR) repeat protein